MNEGLSKYDIASLSRKDLLRLLYAYQHSIDLNIVCSITDTDGNIIYVNNKFCEISGYSRKELLGQNHRIVNSGFHPASFFKNLWDTITKGEIWQGEVMSKRKDGSCFWLLSVILPVLDEKGKIIQFFSLRYPIDEKKNAEAEKEKYLVALEEMLFMTSHEVRLPVANILGAADLLANTELSKDEFKKLVDYMKQSAQSLDTFTRNLTTFIYELKEKHQQKND